MDFPSSGHGYVTENTSRFVEGDDVLSYLQIEIGGVGMSLVRLFENAGKKEQEGFDCCKRHE